MNASVTRRQVLRWGPAAGAAVVLSGAPTAAWARPGKTPAGRVRAYVLVIDGCRPDEIGRVLTPNLAAVRDGGTSFPAARSLPVMETIPNHVMMMTGARPDRTGVPANKIFDRAEGVIRDLDRPADLRFPTLLERLNETGRTTGTVLSKEYLFGIFGERATYRWEPQPIIPVSGHAPDVATMDALIAMVDAADPDLVFANLGDIDRLGHSDLTGTTLQAARTTALVSTDVQIGRFVGHLKSTGKWETSVILVLADHSMDWSIPTNLISVDQILRGREDLRSQIVIAQNGGADLLYWTGSAGEKDRGLAEVASLVGAYPGVLAVGKPSDLRLGLEAGDLIATCRAGWRFSDPTILSNPIPGNHGHPATRPPNLFRSSWEAAVRGWCGARSPRSRREQSTSHQRSARFSASGHPAAATTARPGPASSADPGCSGGHVVGAMVALCRPFTSKTFPPKTMPCCDVERALHTSPYRSTSSSQSEIRRSAVGSVDSASRTDVARRTIRFLQSSLIRGSSIRFALGLFPCLTTLVLDGRVRSALRVVRTVLAA